jgi:hypothetical protein
MQEYKAAVMQTWDALDIGLNPSLDMTARRMGSLAFESGEASNNLIDMAESADGAAPEVENLDEKLRSLNDISPSFGSDIQTELNKLTFLQAGGMIFQNIYAQIKDAWNKGNITNEEATTMFKEAYLGAAAVGIKMGESKEAAITGIMDTFDATYSEARKLLDDFIREQSSRTIRLRVELSYPGVAANIANDELQSGQDINGNGVIGGAKGLNFTVPPGFPNDSFGPIFVQSGEKVNVTPAGQSPAGGTNVFNFYGVSTAEVMRQLKLQGVGR